MAKEKVNVVDDDEDITMMREYIEVLRHHDVEIKYNMIEERRRRMRNV